MHDRDADAGVLELVPQRLGKAADRELARRIGGLAGGRDDAEDARQIDDLRGRLLPQHRQERLAHPHRAPEIDREQPFHVGEADLVEAPEQRDAGIVDQHARPSVLGKDRLAQGIRRGRIRHVRGVLADRHPRLASRGRDRGKRVAVAIDERQTATAGRQAHRQRRADAFGGAGHDRDAVSERKCHRRFSFDENIQACHADTLAIPPNPTPASFPP